MVCPAIIYLLFNAGTPFARGWGIPMATDIAFSLGILSLLGNRISTNLKIFLTALAIIDDLGGILTIAIFYTAGIQTGYLLAAAGIFAVLILLNVCKVKQLVFYIIPGLLLWYCIYNSGIHATIAGVLLAGCIPLKRLPMLINRLHDPVNFVIMPVFALSNTAIILPPDLLQAFNNTISYGVIAGLVIGKPLGITGVSYLATRFKIAVMPEDASWRQLLGVSMIAGIGFTMSIFISTLAFTDLPLQLGAKVAVIAASLISGIIGYSYLRK